MSVARHHAEWLSLVESSGPFLSMPVLLRTFPQGLEARDVPKATRLREAYEDWLERGEKQPAVHHAWILHVLTNLLEFPRELLAEGQSIPPGLEASQPLFGETLRPDFALKHRDSGGRPQLLITIYPPQQDLERPVSGSAWKASPGTRMMELLHASDVSVGLVTNGEDWMLVYAPRGETTGFTTWTADLWMQEPITLRAFHSLLHLRRFLGVAADETLPELLKASAKDQQEVTEQLGFQVRKAVEVLVQAFDKIDAESERKLLAGLDERELYNSALTVMMRLVFLFSAEEKGMLLLGDRLYDNHYAVSSLRELLRERADQFGEEILERREDAWCRLLATFRAVHAGVQHESMRLPAYGGTLFDPERYPFLEGRAAGTKWTDAEPLKINNRVVLHLLEALQILRVKVPGGGPAEARRLSFRALDIEQIGHVYEGLLDHTAKRAHEVVLGLSGSSRQDCEVPLARLEELRAKGVAQLVEFLGELTGRSAKALTKAVENPDLLDAHKLLIACGQDSRLETRVRPFASLVREDSFGHLMVIREGSVFVTSGSDRRSTGTHYTPRSLTEPIVKHTLEPLVYAGPAEGKPENEWQLKTPKELLDLKVCDLAMGSGAFLVQACRYLSERLVEAWERCERANPGQVLITPEGGFSAGDTSERLVPRDPGERLAIARRYVADRCLFGVDINPMAVEMAKLSLWLVTMQRNLPFTFLNHALKCGDSLLGVTSGKQIENFSLRDEDTQVTFGTVNLFRYLEEAAGKRRELERVPSNDPGQIETKTRLFNEAEAATAKVKAIADALIAFELNGYGGKEYEDQRTMAADRLDLAIRKPLPEMQTEVRTLLNGRRPLHWAVEFPEVFERGGFDAFVGNPPFLGGRRIRGALGIDFLEYLTSIVFNNSSRNADLCAFFFLRGFQLVSLAGNLGLLATKTISEGDTLSTGLNRIVENDGIIFRTRPSLPWPGIAAVVVSVVYITKEKRMPPYYLDDVSVNHISSALTATVISGDAQALIPNLGKSFQGSIALGMGFVLETDIANQLLKICVRNKDVIRRFVNGEDANTRPDHSPSRWIINFFDRSLEEAAMYPECLEIIKDKVKPGRQRLNAVGEFVLRKPLPQRWWQFADKRPALYATIVQKRRVLVVAATSRTLAFCFLPVGFEYANTLYVFALDKSGQFAVLQSGFHEVWARQRAGSLKGDLRYTSDIFETFPRPIESDALDSAGERYYQFRAEIMLARNEGLTKTYNRFHDRIDTSPDIQTLRDLHVEMDRAVAAAYGWSDLDLGHGFHPTKQGVRFTLSEPARRTVLDKLLALNHERYKAEMEAGLHDKKSSAKGRGKKAKKDDKDAELFA